MDRNAKRFAKERADAVALLAEGVDRNTYSANDIAALKKVALLAEGVDRNTYNDRGADSSDRSPSSRRAWIEISPAG